MACAPSGCQVLHLSWNKLWLRKAWSLPSRTFILNVYFWERERESVRACTSRGEAERRRRGIQSGPCADSTEPDAGPQLANCEVVTWAEVGYLPDWATQVPLDTEFNWKLKLHLFGLWFLVINVLWGPWGSACFCCCALEWALMRHSFSWLHLWALVPPWESVCSQKEGVWGCWSGGFRYLDCVSLFKHLVLIVFHEYCLTTKFIQLPF